MMRGGGLVRFLSIFYCQYLIAREVFLQIWDAPILMLDSLSIFSWVKTRVHFGGEELTRWRRNQVFFGKISFVNCQLAVKSIC